MLGRDVFGRGVLIHAAKRRYGDQATEQQLNHLIEEMRNENMRREIMGSVSRSLHNSTGNLLTNICLQFQTNVLTILMGYEDICNVSVSSEIADLKAKFEQYHDADEAFDPNKSIEEEDRQAQINVYLWGLFVGVQYDFFLDRKRELEIVANASSTFDALLKDLKTDIQKARKSKITNHPDSLFENQITLSIESYLAAAQIIGVTEHLPKLPCSFNKYQDIKRTLDIISAYGKKQLEQFANDFTLLQSDQETLTLNIEFGERLEKSKPISAEEIDEFSADLKHGGTTKMQFSQIIGNRLEQNKGTSLPSANGEADPILFLKMHAMPIPSAPNANMPDPSAPNDEQPGHPHFEEKTLPPHIQGIPGGLNVVQHDEKEANLITGFSNVVDLRNVHLIHVMGKREEQSQSSKMILKNLNNPQALIGTPELNPQASHHEITPPRISKTPSSEYKLHSKDSPSSGTKKVGAPDQVPAVYQPSEEAKLYSFLNPNRNANNANKNPSKEWLLQRSSELEKQYYANVDERMRLDKLHDSLSKEKGYNPERSNQIGELRKKSRALVMLNYDIDNEFREHNNKLHDIYNHPFSVIDKTYGRDKPCCNIM